MTKRHAQNPLTLKLLNLFGQFTISTSLQLCKFLAMLEAHSCSFEAWTLFQDGFPILWPTFDQFCDRFDQFCDQHLTNFVTNIWPILWPTLWFLPQDGFHSHPYQDHPLRGLSCADCVSGCSFISLPVNFHQFTSQFFNFYQFTSQFVNFQPTGHETKMHDFFRRVHIVWCADW